MTRYQPIESAPRDGTYVLLLIRWSENPVVGYWNARQQKWHADTEHFGVHCDSWCYGGEVSGSLEQKDVMRWASLPPQMEDADISPSTADGLRAMADPMFEGLIDERTTAPCTDCGAPSEPATICASCSTARCVDLGRTEWAKHTIRCTDCHEPTGPVVVCEACATARGESIAAAQRQRDADICRSIHSTSRQRTELALLCASTIECNRS